MKKLIIGLVLVTCLLLPVSCASPASMPAPAPPILTNSESASRIAELEARIRELEAENQRLLEENEQLNTELVKVTAVLQNLQSLVNSSGYINTISNLTEVQNKTSELAYSVESLPDLPPLPPGLTLSKVEQMVEMAQFAYDLIYHLPPLPPLPPELGKLEANRQTLLEVFKFVRDLRDLPEFLRGAESLGELRSGIETYLSGVQNTASDAGSLMQQVKDSVAFD